MNEMKNLLPEVAHQAIQAMSKPSPEQIQQAHVDEAILRLVADGDCARLSNDQKTRYYMMRCDTAGLDPRTQPFQFINLNRKLVLYATKAATDQLTRNHRLSFSVTAAETVSDCYVVRGWAGNDARKVDDLGAVPIKGLSGEALANAMMKALTKCRRRAVLSWAGLGMTDESELEGIPGARPQVTVTPLPPRESTPVAPSVGSAAEADEPPPPGDGDQPPTTEEAPEVRVEPPLRPEPSGTSAFDTLLRDLVNTPPGAPGREKRLALSKRVMKSTQEGALSPEQLAFLREEYKRKEEGWNAT